MVSSNSSVSALLEAAWRTLAIVWHRAACVRSAICALFALMTLNPLSLTGVQAAVFRSTYTGVAIFEKGAERYGKINNSDYDFTAVYTYDTTKGTIVSDPLSERFSGPVSGSLNISSTLFAINSAGFVSRSESITLSSFIKYDKIAQDGVGSGPDNFFFSSIEFLSQTAPDPYIPLSVTTPFEAQLSSPPFISNGLGEFYFDSGLVRGNLGTASLVVSELPAVPSVPLPRSASLFATALILVGLAGYRAKRNAPATG